ncbi:MAG: DUF4326 domain-containing protein [Hyphomicrobiales bacterium]
MAKPRRIQVKRRKGWRLPEGAVYVGRPTRWGNPYRLGKEAESREQVVDMYREMLDTLPPDELSALLEPLKGRDLACWCPEGAPCHGDVLLTLANA